MADWQRKADKGITYEMYLTGQGQFNQYAADGYLYLQDLKIATEIEAGDVEAARARLRFAQMYAQYYANQNLDLFLPADEFGAVLNQACMTDDPGKIMAAYFIFMTVIGLSDHDHLGGGRVGSGYNFVTPRPGVTVPIPKGWQSRPADNGRGIVYQRPGATGNSDMIRVMDPTDQYPQGYIRYYNKHGQPLDVNGKPGSRDVTHIPLDYEGPIPGWPK